MHFTAKIAAILTVAGASGCAPALLSAPPVGTAAVAANSADARLDSLADKLVQLQISYDPTSAYFIGVKPADHRRWPDRGPEARARQRALRDQLLHEIMLIEASDLSPAKRYIQGSMIERLDGDRRNRVCQFELWDVNHLSGWHLRLAEIAQEQPLSTADERAQALERWSALGQLVDQEISNARTGLQAGYSSPRSVVLRVLSQLEAVVSAPTPSLPFYAMVKRSDDAQFKGKMESVLAGPVNKAFKRYRDFVANEYLPRSRNEIAISAHPNGKACYAASLRGYTTLQRTPEEVFRLGRDTVNGNIATVRQLSQRAFGTTDISEIVKRVGKAPDNHFQSEDDLIRYSREVVSRSKEKSTSLFLKMPKQEMQVEPLHAYQRGSGGSSYYENQIDPLRPAYYRIASERWATITRGDAEITAVHEGYPGHHMQTSFATMVAEGPVANLLDNAAYAEGWARYSEMLAEEAGIYQTVYAPISRRLWPARGMVVDPGLHLMGWTREQAVAYIQESGRFLGKEADDLVDRIAVWPGQLTAYDSGALEILALRREAEKELGAKFDLREFHARVLETGRVPLGTLRANITEWIVRVKSGRQK